MSTPNKDLNSKKTDQTSITHYSEMFDDLFGNSSDIDKKSTKKKTNKNAVIVCTNNENNNKN